MCLLDQSSSRHGIATIEVSGSTAAPTAAPKAQPAATPGDQVVPAKPQAVNQRQQPQATCTS